MFLVGIDYRRDRKEKGEEVGKGKWEAEDLQRPNKTKNGTRGYTGEGPSTSQPSLNNLWRTLMSPFKTEFKIFKEDLAKCPQSQFIKGCGQLQGMCSNSYLRYTLQ